jgi:hypothetical protein
MAKIQPQTEKNLPQSVEIGCQPEKVLADPLFFPGPSLEFSCKNPDFWPFARKSSKIAFSYDWGKICMHHFPH